MGEWQRNRDKNRGSLSFGDEPPPPQRARPPSNGSFSSVSGSEGQRNKDRNRGTFSFGGEEPAPSYRPTPKESYHAQPLPDDGYYAQPLPDDDYHAQPLPDDGYYAQPLPDDPYDDGYAPEPTAHGGGHGDWRDAAPPPRRGNDIVFKSPTDPKERPPAGYRAPKSEGVSFGSESTQYDRGSRMQGASRGDECASSRSGRDGNSGLASNRLKNRGTFSFAPEPDTPSRGVGPFRSAPFATDSNNDTDPVGPTAPGRRLTPQDFTGAAGPPAGSRPPPKNAFTLAHADAPLYQPPPRGSGGTGDPKGLYDYSRDHVPESAEQDLAAYAQGMAISADAKAGGRAIRLASTASNIFPAADPRMTRGLDDPDRPIGRSRPQIKKGGYSGQDSMQRDASFADAHKAAATVRMKMTSHEAPFASYPQSADDDLYGPGGAVGRVGPDKHMRGKDPRELAMEREKCAELGKQAYQLRKGAAQAAGEIQRRAEQGNAGNVLTWGATGEVRHR